MAQPCLAVRTCEVQTHPRGRNGAGGQPVHDRSLHGLVPALLRQAPVCSAGSPVKVLASRAPLPERFFKFSIKCRCDVLGAEWILLAGIASQVYKIRGMFVPGWESFSVGSENVSQHVEQAQLDDGLAEFSVTGLEIWPGWLWTFAVECWICLVLRKTNFRSQFRCFLLGQQSTRPSQDS